MKKLTFTFLTNELKRVHIKAWNLQEATQKAKEKLQELNPYFLTLKL